MLDVHFKTEDALVEKIDGTIIGPYPAQFAGKSIIISDIEADIEEGDTILRDLPSGRQERNIVTQADYHTSTLDAQFKPSIHVKFKRPNAISASKPAPVINVTGPNSTVQIGDHNTQNIANAMSDLAERINSTDADEQEKEKAKTLLGQFLKHPLVGSILGASIAPAIELLK
ncbi:hypothetical protein [Grimontia sp. NTOU-MAR1]|uniref:hypothetical protein n=1 Tax=Grimontia sp. NTOU-MAR1 TaxID=3111011 RepID=UPI002DBBE52B|nr:hypothetical protein [Grimontia sp. NTOU-MAR1]WRV98252.1 hypothetical protein VP504_02105 [Grimontia sp. NTOU-MAR1]